MPLALERCDAVVVQPHQRDHLFDVGFALDLAGRHLRRVPVDRVRPDATLLAQLRADLSRKSEVGGVVAVQVADLMPPDPKPELAPTPGTGLHARPRGDLFSDPLARCLCSRHTEDRTTASALEVKADCDSLGA
jgi:hypothetical protein